jgi:hypothetical protein
MKIYFDTSAINAITSDPLKPKIVDRLITYHEPLISWLTLPELLATPQQERRYKLLRVASNLSKITEPPYHRLLLDEPEMMVCAVEAFLKQSEPTSYFKSRDELFQLPVLLNPRLAIDQLAAICREWTDKAESQYRVGMKTERDEFQQLFNDNALVQSRRSHFLREGIKRKDVLKNIIETILLNEAFIHLRDRLIGRELEILEKLQVWRFHIAGNSIDRYNRVVRLNRYGHKSNPGWVDTRQAAYLAAADVFVTDDIGQRNFMRIVSRFSPTPKRVWSYERLKANLNL